jgi:hypothetical protein
VFTNRHVVIALIVAPALSIAGWWAAGEFAGEQPQPARPGQSYPLLEKSNCRYSSGTCDLQNAELKLSLLYTEGDAGNALLVRSSHGLDGILVSLGPGDGEAQPRAMVAVDDMGRQWRLMLAGLPDAQDRIRLAARASGSAYFGEAGTAFLHPDTTGDSTP